MQTNPNIDKKITVEVWDWKDPDIIYYYNHGKRTKSHKMKIYFRKVRRKRLGKQFLTDGQWEDGNNLLMQDY